MRILIAAVGRLKAGPERDLADRYLDRAVKTGRPLGLNRLDVREISEGRAVRPDDRKAEEAAELLALIPADAEVVVLDEGGRSTTSEGFADFIASARDRGVADLVFAIGGPDGHGPALKARAKSTLAFGAMTWPHQIVRVLLAEQIYRATTILSGHPYHRA
ncbi:MAG: 23S rRNA (pseudouridine(1915)-N(3))-methyltransferase RlmH [Ancalomicrobiaceae bacterium]|nr:23S rRNA (pseudouridine(1915)-N(3))-methyltransferase RlmH [Ancalomicrobiaceae bacterium]